MSLETTLILLKPDAVEKNISGKVLARFQETGFAIRGIKMMTLDKQILRDHYSELTEMPFYQRLETFMLRAPVIALALEGEDAIAKAREILGATDSTKADAGTIRADFGEDVSVNVCHASDSLESAAAELKRFFKDEELFSY